MLCRTSLLLGALPLDPSRGFASRPVYGLIALRALITIHIQQAGQLPVPECRARAVDAVAAASRYPCHALQPAAAAAA